MKVTFIFSDSAEPEMVRDHSIKTSFEFPDTVAALPDARERVLKFAELVGKLTRAVLHVDCSELGLRHHPIRLSPEVINASVTFAFRHTLLRFERWQGRRMAWRQITIILPVSCPIPYSTPTDRQKSRNTLPYYLIPSRVSSVSSDAQRDYLAVINELAEHTQYLLNTDPTIGQHAWAFVGFHPEWKDKAAITKYNKKVDKEMRQEIAAARRKAKQEAAGKVVSPKPTASSGEVPKHGAGRRPGAIPGVFKGVQMRSQLEIRFAAELENRGIRWVYEAERLGEEQYLVDFYLPDLGIWVEVKGTFEPRDEFQLPAVAAYLKRNRNEKLCVFTSGAVFCVKPSQFSEITRKVFWDTIEGL